MQAFGVLETPKASKKRSGQPCRSAFDSSIWIAERPIWIARRSSTQTLSAQEQYVANVSLGNFL